MARGVGKPDRAGTDQLLCTGRLAWPAFRLLRPSCFRVAPLTKRMKQKNLKMDWMPPTPPRGSDGSILVRSSDCTEFRHGSCSLDLHSQAVFTPKLLGNPCGEGWGGPELRHSEVFTLEAVETGWDAQDAHD